MQWALFGAVKTYYFNACGEEHITGFYLPGEYIGVDELSEEFHRGYVQVIDNCGIYHLSWTELSELMDSGDERRYVYRMMSEHLRLNKARFRQLTRLSAGERLAGFIYDLAVRYGFQGCAVRDFRLPMLRCDIANYIGVTPESLTGIIGIRINRMRETEQVGLCLLLAGARLPQVRQFGGEFSIHPQLPPLFQQPFNVGGDNPGEAALLLCSGQPAGEKQVFLRRECTLPSRRASATRAHQAI